MALFFVRFAESENELSIAKSIAVEVNEAKGDNMRT